MHKGPRTATNFKAWRNIMAGVNQQQLIDMTSVPANLIQHWETKDDSDVPSWLWYVVTGSDKNPGPAPHMKKLFVPKAHTPRVIEEQQRRFNERFNFSQLNFAGLQTSAEQTSAEQTSVEQTRETSKAEAEDIVVGFQLSLEAAAIVQRWENDDINVSARMSRLIISFESK